MKARVVRLPRLTEDRTDNWCVEITQGQQSFRLRYDGSRAECRWMVKMFNHALKAHDKERDA